MYECQFASWTKPVARLLRFLANEPAADEGGFSAVLRDALLAFRKKYPKTRFIDVEFAAQPIFELVRRR
jgi:hypothetical protein